MQGDATENEWFEKIWRLAENKEYFDVIQITLPYWEKIPEPKFENDFSFHVIHELFYSYLKLNKLEEARIWLDNFEQFDFKKADRDDDGDFEIAKGNYYWAINDHETALQSWAIADKKTKGQCFRSPEAALAKSAFKNGANTKVSSSRKNTKSTEKEIKNTCKLGSDFMDNKEFAKAEACFLKALKSLPDPAENHEFYHWIMASLGDAELSGNKLYASEQHLLEATKGMADNPYVWLQLGRSYRLQSKFESSTDALLRAYMLEGEVIFEESSDDFAFLKSRVKL